MLSTKVVLNQITPVDKMSFQTSILDLPPEILRIMFQRTEFETTEDLRNPKTLASRCASEPIKVKKKLSVTPRTSPLNFAGSKCLEPPTPTSLPCPPTTWTKVPEKKNSFSAKQTLSFDDLVGINPDLDPLSQHLKLLLNVQG